MHGGKCESYNSETDSVKASGKHDIDSTVMNRSAVEKKHTIVSVMWYQKPPGAVLEHRYYINIYA